MIGNFQYQLQGEQFDAIHASRADLVVVDVDDCGFTREQVGTIAARKTVLSYLSIGQASSYRWYWDEEWVDEKADPIAGKAPPWLGPRSAWDKSYEVRYWDEGWLAILKQSIDRMLACGYAGVVYDVVDAFAYWEKRGEWTAKARMKTLVGELMAHGRSKRPAYIGIPNAGVELLTDAAYLARITAQLCESVYYLGEEPRSAADSGWATAYLDRVAAEGKQVFVLEYPQALASQKDAIKKARAKGYVPYTTTPRLDVLGPVWQDVLKNR